MKFQDIEQFPFASYTVNQSWRYLQDWIDNNNKDIMKCDMNPFFQRGYVWTKEQKTAYIEYQLKGGFSGKDIFWNCPTWMNIRNDENIITLVDGKQRLSAVLGFLNDKVKAFGLKYSEFEGKIPIDIDLIFHINNLKTTKEVVKWYVGFNTGGSIHTEEDLKPALDYLREGK